MKRFILLVAAVAFTWGCAATTETSSNRDDGSSDSAEVRERRAKDLADCTAEMGAPTSGGQSTMGYSRGQVQDCMRSRGWQK